MNKRSPNGPDWCDGLHPLTVGENGKTSARLLGNFRGRSLWLFVEWENMDTPGRDAGTPSLPPSSEDLEAIWMESGGPRGVRRSCRIQGLWLATTATPNQPLIVLQSFSFNYTVLIMVCICLQLLVAASCYW